MQWVKETAGIAPRRLVTINGKIFLAKSLFTGYTISKAQTSDFVY